MKRNLPPEYREDKTDQKQHQNPYPSPSRSRLDKRWCHLILTGRTFCTVTSCLQHHHRIGHWGLRGWVLLWIGRVLLLTGWVLLNGHVLLLWGRVLGGWGSLLALFNSGTIVLGENSSHFHTSPAILRIRVHT